MSIEEVKVKSPKNILKPVGKIQFIHSDAIDLTDVAD